MQTLYYTYIHLLGNIGCLYSLISAMQVHIRIEIIMSFQSLNDNDVKCIVFIYLELLKIHTK